MLIVVALIILVVVAGALGRRLFRLLKLSFTGPLEDLIFSIAMGLGLLGLLTFFLGACSLLYPASAYVVAILACLGCMRDVAGVARDLVSCPLAGLRSTRGFMDKALLLLLAAVLILNILGAMAPPSQVDPLIYHLAGPKRYLAAHRLHYIPYNLFFSYPCHLQMIYLFSMMMDGESLPQVVHCVFGILMVLTVLHMSGKGCRRRGLVAGFVFIAVGGFLGQSIFAMVDLGLGCFSLLAFVAFYRWVQDGDRNWILACAFFCGFAMGTKLPGATVPFAIAFLILMRAVVRRAGLPGAVYLSTLLIAVSLAVGSPSYIKNYVFTGNPLYPFFNTIFEGRDLTPAFFESFLRQAFLDRMGIADKAKLLLVMPWKLTQGTWVYNIYDSYLIGPLYLCLLPLLLHPAFRPGRQDRYMLAFSLVFVVMWVVLVPLVRFAYVLWALLAVVVSRTWERLPAGLARAAASFAIAAWVTFQVAFNLYVQFPAYRAALGIMKKSDYLNKVLPLHSQGYFRGYDAFEWMNANLPAGSYVLSTTNMNYYLDYPSLSLVYYILHTYGGEDAVFESEFGAEGGGWPLLSVSPEKMLDRFHSMGVTHMFILEGLGTEQSPRSLAVALAYLEDMGLLRKIYGRGSASVYEIAKNHLFTTFTPEI